MTEHEKRLKKILYRAWYRGNKETDKIIGGFAKKYINELNENELDELEEILAMQDVDIYDWLSHKRPAPEELKDNSIFQRLYNFIPAEEV